MSERLPRISAEAPVTLQEVSAALGDSVLARAVARFWGAIVKAAAHSRFQSMVHASRSSLADCESAVLASGIVLVTAMAVHLLLLSVQPYPFPGHSTKWLPAALLAAGVLLILGRRPVAAAWRDRNNR